MVGPAEGLLVGKGSMPRRSWSATARPSGEDSPGSPRSWEPRRRDQHDVNEMVARRQCTTRDHPSSAEKMGRSPAAEPSGDERKTTWWTRACAPGPSASEDSRQGKTDDGEAKGPMEDLVETMTRGNVRQVERS